MAAAMLTLCGKRLLRVYFQVIHPLEKLHQNNKSTQTFSALLWVLNDSTNK
jgi:hypothetical protein